MKDWHVLSLVSETSGEEFVAVMVKASYDAAAYARLRKKLAKDDLSLEEMDCIDEVATTAAAVEYIQAYVKEIT